MLFVSFILGLALALGLFWCWGTKIYLHLLEEVFPASFQRFPPTVGYAFLQFFIGILSLCIYAIVFILAPWYVVFAFLPHQGRWLDRDLAFPVGLVALIIWALPALVYIAKHNRKRRGSSRE